MAPLLTDGAGREAYTPWGHRDMTTLAKLLPSRTAGASAWIRKFETETIGDVLALGDIRAIIGRTQGIEQSVELERLTETANLVDRTPFDRYRNLFWGCLRELSQPTGRRLMSRGKPTSPISPLSKDHGVLWETHGTIVYNPPWISTYWNREDLIHSSTLQHAPSTS